MLEWYEGEKECWNGVRERRCSGAKREERKEEDKKNMDNRTEQKK